MSDNPYNDLVSRLQEINPQDPRFVHRLNELVSINELLTTISTAGNLEETLDIMLLTIMGQYLCLKGAIYIKSNNAWLEGISKGVKKGEVNPAAFPMDDSWSELEPLVFLDKEAPQGMADALKPFRLVFPVRNEDQVVGIIALGKSMSVDGGADKELMLRTIADFGGVMIGNSLYRDELQRQLFQLHTLYEITGAFARCLENEEVFQVLANNLMGQFFISRCAVLNFEDKTCRVLFQKNIKAADETLELTKTLDDWCAAVEEANDTACQVTSEFMKKHKLRYVLPIASEGRREGLLLLGDRLDRKALSAADKDFILSIAQQSASAVENIRLQKASAEKKRMERELALAREIQQKLLPKDVPEIEGYDLAVEMRPFFQVGGDFYDFISFEDGRLTICLADVSGKSLPASMIMSTAQASLRALNAFGRHTPKEIIEKLNLHMWQSTQSNKFITMFYAVLDPSTHRIDYINAGHNRPMLLKPNGEMEELGLGGMVLGLFPGATYKVGSIVMEPGAELLIFTDGLSEVTDGTEEEYGDDRLADSFRSVCGKGTALEAKNCIVNSAMEFSNNEMIDDLTLLLVRRKTDE